jgi:predicted double-glycine peptidase
VRSESLSCFQLRELQPLTISTNALLAFVLAFVLAPAALGTLAALVRARSAHPLRLRVKQHLPVLGPAFLLLSPVFVICLVSEHSETVCLSLPLWVQGNTGLLCSGSASTLVVFVAVYCTTIARACRFPRTRSVLLAAVLLGISGPLSYWRIHRPIADALSERRTPTGVIMQTSSSSCTAAILANVTAYFGDPITERDAATLLGTTPFGTSPGQMRYALTHLGIDFEMLAGNSETLTTLEAPAILSVDHPSTGPESHSVGYFGRCEDGEYEIWDPLIGKRCLSEERLLKVWHGHGIQCLRAARH